MQHKEFLIGVLLLGAFGLICCIIWFILLVEKNGLSLGWGIFFFALFVFCTWAIVEGVIKPLKIHEKQTTSSQRTKGISLAYSRRHTNFHKIWRRDYTRRVLR